jgi:hypothetical protein
MAPDLPSCPTTPGRRCRPRTGTVQSAKRPAVAAVSSGPDGRTRWPGGGRTSRNLQVAKLRRRRRWPRAWSCDAMHRPRRCARRSYNARPNTTQARSWPPRRRRPIAGWRRPRLTSSRKSVPPASASGPCHHRQGLGCRCGWSALASWAVAAGRAAAAAASADTAPTASGVVRIGSALGCATVRFDEYPSPCPSAERQRVR